MRAPDGFIVPIRDPEIVMQIVEHSLRCPTLLYGIDQEIRMAIQRLTLVNHKTHFADTYQERISLFDVS